MTGPCSSDRAWRSSWKARTTTAVAYRIRVNSAKVSILPVVLVVGVVKAIVDTVGVYEILVERIDGLHRAHDRFLRFLEIIEIVC